MSRQKILLGTLATVLAVSLCVAVPSAQAFNDWSGIWSTLTNPQDSNWEGTLSVEEQMALDDGICGPAWVYCFGATALASGGIIAISATWQSGIGKSFGSWLANLGSLTQSALFPSIATTETWCPYAHPGTDFTGGPFPANPYTLSTLAPSASNCRGTSPVGLGPILPLHAYQSAGPSVNTDKTNYFTLDFSSNTNQCMDAFSSGFYGGNNTNDITLLVDPTKYVGGSLSSNLEKCQNAFFDEYISYFANPAQWSLVAVPNAGCVDSATGAGCSQTCSQLAVSADSHSSPAPTGYTGQCYWVVATEKQFMNMLGPITLTKCGFTGQATCPATTKTFGSATAGTPTNCGGVVTPCTAALNKLDLGEESTFETCWQSGTCMGNGSTTLTLPRPQITETYDSYIARLRAAGFWGHIYEVDDDMDYPVGTPGYQLVPKLITEVQVGTTQPIPLYWPLPGHGLSGAPSSTPNAGQYRPWPSGSTTAPPSTDITIMKVPDTYSAGGGGGGGGGPCNCPGIDFSPLTGLSYGTAFPFGVFSFLNSANSSFTGAGSGTPISFTLPLDGSSQIISLQSTRWETTYRPIVFGILEFLITLAGVVWLALRVIGHPGGDAEGTD